MTEILPQSPPGTQAEPVNPNEVLLNFIIALLAPIFGTASGGDLQCARLAAIDTISAYYARSPVDLLAIAQIVGCSLTALSSFSLSLANDLSLPMILRLRSNGIALNRAAELNRRALTAPRNATPDITPHDPVYEATVMANLAAARKLAAQAMADLDKAESAIAPTPVAEPEPAPPALPTTEDTLSERAWQVMVANAMTSVATKLTAEMADLPPAERALASYRVDGLSTAASEVIRGDIPSRLRPGDLSPFIPRDPA